MNVALGHAATKAQLDAITLCVPMDEVTYNAKRKEIASGAGLRVVVLDAQVAAAREALRHKDWTRELHRTQNLKPKATVLNVMIALRTAPEWQGVWAYDGFAQRIMIDGPPPWQGSTGNRPMLDVDAIHTMAWMQEHGIDVKLEATFEAITAVAFDRERHPVRDYLRGLTWDGVPRLDTWLIDHMGAEDTPLIRAFARKWMIGAVARVSQPGCKNDVCLVLEGPQDLGKSTALAVLTGRAWFTDHGSDITTKDAKVELLGVWVREIAEFAALRRTDVESAKAFLSTPVDVFRKPYGRVAERVPRQTVFAATVNPSSTGYLRDETGARRFWPVLCGVGWKKGRTVDLPKLEAARDQLWAEAWFRYCIDETWWLDNLELREAQESAVDERYDLDSWSDGVNRHLEAVTKDAKEAGGSARTTTTEILRALGKSEGQHERRDQTRVGSIMAQRRDWTKRQVVQNGSRLWVFVRVDRDGEESAQPTQPELSLSDLVK